MMALPLPSPVRLLLAGLITALAALTMRGSVPPAAAQTPTSRPNIVFVLTDDLDSESFDHFPVLKSLLVDQGTSFSNYLLSVALCCPSRSSFLRGQYAHNTQIFTNAPPGGGFQTFHQRGEEDSTIATWLQAAGYRTALMGKYLNGYPQGVSQTYVPPGWDEWDSPAAGNPYSEYNYRMNENGRLVSYGRGPDDYMVDVIARKSSDFIRRAGADSLPFFLYLPVYAPHQPATAPPRYADAFAGVSAPRTPSFNEEDMSDKPAWLRDRPPLQPRATARIDALYRRRLQSMLAVQDLVQTLVETLRETGQLDNTYIVFSSDNGFHLGQHRLQPGKNTGFEEDVRVPLIVRGPGVPAGRQVDQLAGNVDLAPTFAELAGARAPDFVDGRSLAPLLHAGTTVGVAWRDAYLLEHGADVRPPSAVGPQALQRRSSGILEPPDPFDRASLLQSQGATRRGLGNPPPFAGLRTQSYTYIEYATGERELYELRRDPYQLDNIAGTADPALIASLSAQLAEERTCAGVTCRIADSLPIAAASR